MIAREREIEHGREHSTLRLRFDLYLCLMGGGREDEEETSSSCDVTGCRHIRRHHRRRRRRRRRRRQERTLTSGRYPPTPSHTCSRSRSRIRNNSLLHTSSSR